MADIVKVDLTDIADSQLATWQEGFELDSYADGGTVTLKAGFVEFLGGYPYRVETGDLTITPGALSDGAVYLYLTEDGDGTATATLSNTAPTYDVAKGGYYNSLSKAIFRFTLATASYNDRVRMYRSDKVLFKSKVFLTDVNINGTTTITGNITQTGGLAVTGNITGTGDISRTGALTVTGLGQFQVGQKPAVTYETNGATRAGIYGTLQPTLSHEQVVQAIGEIWNTVGPALIVRFNRVQLTGAGVTFSGFDGAGAIATKSCPNVADESLRVSMTM